MAVTRPDDERGGEGFLTRAAEAELRAEVERLRGALRDLLDRQHDYPTDLSDDPEWHRAFDEARFQLDGGMRRERNCPSHGVCPLDGAPLERDRIVTAYTQRVKIGVLYTDGNDLWEVVEVNDLGMVTLRGERSKTARMLGIDVFRRRFWLVRPRAS